MHQSAYLDAKYFINKYLKIEQKLNIADIGSLDINGTLRPLFSSPNWNYTGYDIVSGKNVDIVLSKEYDWDIQSNRYDVVVSTQVLEHVRHPWRWIKEIHRICKINGLVYICAPNTIHFHEHPVDCWRIWPEGMRSLLEEADLISLEVYRNPPIITPGTIGDTTGIAIKKKISPFFL